MSKSKSEAADRLLARGGGDATAAGVRFEAALGALFGADLLAGHPLDGRLRLGNAKPLWIRFETEAPVDDILVATDSGGFVAVQAKLALQFSTTATSDFAKTIEQLVRQFLACRNGDGKRDWNRPLDPSRDRLLLAIGPRSSVTIRQHLAEALNARRQPGAGAVRPLSEAQATALAAFDSCVTAAWSGLTTEALSEEVVNELSKLTFILTYDVDGGDWTAASVVLGTAIQAAPEGERVLSLMLGTCQELMATRAGVDEQSLRLRLLQRGAKLQPTAAYRQDVTALQTYSLRVGTALAEYEKIEVEKGAVTIRRTCEAAVLDAALEGSLLLIGEPGAGKSAVINGVARDLRAKGLDVVELAVDRLPVASLEGLAGELGLEHSLLEVLRSWDSDAPGYVLIDALDATRGGTSESVFRSLISEIISTRGRWRVIASIRTFDLRLGQQLRTLFKGIPPAPSLADGTFPDVRHIKVPTWTREEFEKLLESAPSLAKALAEAPQKVRDLALVPFNTRLLAELVRMGIDPESVATLRSQVELLRLYWRNRVEVLGEAAGVRLKRLVGLMVEARTLRALRIEAAEGDPAAFQALLQQGVLTASTDERYVSFRHHLLFDYAASRVHIIPERLVAGPSVFPKLEALGLILGPALTFVLRELWTSDEAHRSFWKAIIRLVGDDECDPIVRSIAARTASELPISNPDTSHFAELILLPTAGSQKALGDVVGALAVRMEDKEPIAVAPWAALAASLVATIEVVAWPLRTLSYLLLERTKDPDDRRNLGVVARALMTFALSQDRYNGLSDSAISFVADTYDTAPDISRRLLQCVFDDERFEKFGPEEAPDLARKIDVIAQIDPDFAVEIYRQIYSRSVQDQRVTQMGQSQILSLTSTARQDFEMAQYALGEFFPKFLISHPEHATDALVAAVEGYVAREHTLREPNEIEFEVAGQRVRLMDDLSYIWAADPDSEYRQDAEVLIVAFRDQLVAASPDVAKRAAARMISQNRLSVLWSRLFMAAARLPDVLGDDVSIYAFAEPFLVSLDTRKDAIDVVAATYATKADEDRRAFELSAQHFDFSGFVHPDEARDGMLAQLFGAIGIAHLVTEEAKALVLEGEAHAVPNERPFRITTSWGSTEPYWWLKREGVDLDAPANTKLRAAIDTAKARLGIETTLATQPALPEIMDTLRVLRGAIVAAHAANAAPGLCRCAEGTMADGIKKALSHEELRREGGSEITNEIVEMVVDLAESPFPEIEEATEENFEKSVSWGSPAPRVDAAEAILRLSQIDAALYHRLRPKIEQLLVDSHPAVRLAAGTALVRLWEVDRTGMWQLAEGMIGREENFGVLDHFAGHFLGATLHHAPAQVEDLSLQLLGRVSTETRERANKLAEHLAGILSLLWVSHNRPEAGEVVRSWIADPVEHHTLLGHVLTTLRSGVVHGYEDVDARGDGIRHRAQAIVHDCINATAQRLEVLLEKTELSEEERGDLQVCAKLLDTACSQLFFASGAFKSSNREGKALEGSARLRFLNEVEPSLRRIGQVATPHTIYHLFQLLEFLLPVAPSRVFDLASHALLEGGRRHGYQYESLGADRFVTMVGQCLADYRDIFDDSGRQALLIECLETFQAAGWPSARRLLYRLPELLQ